MNYTTIDNVENYAHITISEEYKPVVLDYIESASRMMDTICNRRLVAPDVGEDPEVRYYNGSNKSTMSIDDVVDIDSIEVGDEWGQNFAAYTSFMSPVGGKSINTLRSTYGRFDYGNSNVKVTGRFGLFAELPKDIEFACTVIVAGIINSSKPSTGEKKSETIGSYSVTYDTSKGFADLNYVKTILEKYTLLTL